MLMRSNVQIEEPAPPPLPDFITQHIDPFSGDDDTADIDPATGRDPVQPAAAGDAARSGDGGGRRGAMQRRSAAMRHARAGRARSTSIATASWRSSAG